MSRYTCGDQKATFGEPDIAFHHEGSEGQIQVFRFGGSHLSLWSHPTEPVFKNFVFIFQKDNT